MFKKLTLAATLALGMLTGTAHAADISGTRMKNGTVIITITGKINLIDGLKFNHLTKNLTPYDKVVVGLNSPGGAVIAGLTIGYKIHNYGWETIVMGDTVCSSACADIWLAGATKYVSPSAKIGMHSEGMKKAIGKGKKRKVATVRGDNKERIEYFVRLGLGKDAIVEMLTPDPDSMMWMTKEKAETLGITYTQLNS